MKRSSDGLVTPPDLRNMGPLIKKILFVSIALLVMAGIAVYVVLLQTRPDYQGEISLKNLNGPVDVYFDTCGIPHIYGNNEKDVFMALGYVEAQDRLFQMELIRRAAGGRLSEIFGNKTLDIDRFFRMLGLNRKAEKEAGDFASMQDSAWSAPALAYLEGLNQFIREKKKPLEFLILHIPMEEFTLKDMFLVIGYTSFNFEMGFRTDPLMSRLEKKLGPGYMQSLFTGLVPGSMVNTACGNSLAEDSPDRSISFGSLMEKIPVKIWMGSNAWVLAAKKSLSGKVLFENDTHIGHQQPAVWYEAHLEYPGMRFYGSFLAGFPFAPLGHTIRHAWGLTMLENDDLDFFEEKTQPDDSNTYYHTGNREKMVLRQEVIRVKDSANILLTVRSTIHGPVCSDVMNDFDSVTVNPVSICWTYLKEPVSLFEVTYNMMHAGNMEDFRSAVSRIAAPGLNILYGDAENNIAWWTAAKLVRRPEGATPSFLMDGSSGAWDWLGYYPFDMNPQSENPSCGFVYSTNNAPGIYRGVNHSGYYVPEDRAVRLMKLLHDREQFSMADMQTFNTDDTNPVAARVAHVLSAVMIPDEKILTEPEKMALALCRNWKGSHGLQDKAPVVYYRWLYHILHDAFSDETGEMDFAAFMKTHVEKCTVAPFVSNDSAYWWDDVHTDKKESRQDIIRAAFAKTVQDIVHLLGRDSAGWAWEKVHTLEIEHPLGKQKPLNVFFNIGPVPIPGGIETLNNQSFFSDSMFHFSATLGPAMRRTLDFSDPENGCNVLPSGQSGVLMSRYYSDQFNLYVEGRIRKELMNREEIQAVSEGILHITPAR